MTIWFCLSITEYRNRGLVLSVFSKKLNNNFNYDNIFPPGLTCHIRVDVSQNKD